MTRLHKEIALTAACITLSIIVFFGLAYVLRDVADYAPLFIALGPLALLWLVATAISLYLISRWDLMSLISVAAGSATIAAGGLNNWGAIGGGILLALLTAGAAQSFKRDSRNLRQYRTISIFTSGGRLLLTGLILAGAGSALPLIEGSIKQEGIAVSPQQVEYVLRPLAPLLRDLAPNVDVTADIDSVIDNQLRQQGVDPVTVPPDQRAALHSQASQQLQVEVTGQESLADIVTGRLNQSLRRLTQVHALTVALVAVVLAFLTIRAVIPLLTWVVLAFIAAGMWFARSTGLVVVVRETIQVDQVTL